MRAIKKAKRIIEKDPKTAKANNKIDAEFNALKNTMVVTTGDMYVGAAEPQLREKLSTIYASVAQQFDAPSPSQKDNIENVMDLYSKATTSLNALKGKYKTKLIDQGTKLGIPFQLKSFATVRS
mgnify:CR=1 FL=1